MTVSDGVPGEVLAAFGADGTVPVPMRGGVGTAWLAGDVVLKAAEGPTPEDAARSGRWFADVYDALGNGGFRGFRVPQPVRARTGDWLAHGWACCRRVPGEAEKDWSGLSPRWPEMIAASRAFHSALAAISVPPPDGPVPEIPWTIADQVAWDERDPDPVLGAAGPLPAQARRLLHALRPVDLPVQQVHADLLGNVLFAAGLPPAVIDFSPLRPRPSGFPLAILAVDTLLWHGASPRVLEHLAGEPDLDQVFARALVYRITENIIRHAGTGFLAEAARAAAPITDLALSRIR